MTNEQVQRFLKEGVKDSGDPKSELVRLAVRAIVERDTNTPTELASVSIGWSRAHAAGP